MPKSENNDKEQTGSSGLPPPPPDPGSLTEVRVDLVVKAGSGLGFRLQANLSAFRTSLLSTT